MPRPPSADDNVDQRSDERTLPTGPANQPLLRRRQLTNERTEKKERNHLIVLPDAAVFYNMCPRREGSSDTHKWRQSAVGPRSSSVEQRWRVEEIATFIKHAGARRVRCIDGVPRSETWHFFFWYLMLVSRDVLLSRPPSTLSMVRQQTPEANRALQVPSMSRERGQNF